MNLSIKTNVYKKLLIKTDGKQPGILIKSLFLLASIFFGFTSLVQAQWINHEFEAMGTHMHVGVWHQNYQSGWHAVELVQQEMNRIDQALSFYQKDSELMKVNQQAAIGEVKVSQELFALLVLSEKISQLSDGAFDITVGAVTRHYQLRENIAPELDLLAELKNKVGHQYIQLDEKKRTVHFEKNGIEIDLGGIAKGYAVDRCIGILNKLGITQAQVTAGGDTRFIGRRGERPWWVGIRHPRDKTQNALVLPIESKAISTSGDYERFFWNGEERIHHILNPSTGVPTQELASVSIVAQTSVQADALSTAVFVMGGEKGLALINKLPDVDAIIIDRTGKVFYSDGFETLGEKNLSLEVVMPEVSTEIGRR